MISKVREIHGRSIGNLKCFRILLDKTIANTYFLASNNMLAFFCLLVCVLFCVHFGGLFIYPFIYLIFFSFGH